MTFFSCGEESCGKGGSGDFDDKFEDKTDILIIGLINKAQNYIMRISLVK